MWIHCKALFNSDNGEMLEELGLQASNELEWTEFSFLLSAVTSFNQSSYHNCATIRWDGDSYATNIPYATMKAIIAKETTDCIFLDEPNIYA